MENRTLYETNPLTELCQLLQPDEIIKLVVEIRRIKDAGGWGEVKLGFKRGKLARPVTTVMPQYDEEEGKLLQNP